VKRVYYRLALRNIIKNRRRSLVTISAVALGFAALTLFRGYTQDVFKQLQLSAVIQEGLGHLTVYKRGWLEEGTLYPDKYLLSKVEQSQIAELAKSIPGVKLVSPKLNMTGLVSNGQVSSIFIAEGVVPQDFNRLIRTEGSLVRGDLDAGEPEGVQFSEGLANMLDLQPGKAAILSSVTLGGSMNAVNAKVTRKFNTGVPDTNDKFVRMPLALAQSLLDSDNADRMMLLLDSAERTDGVRSELVARLKAKGLNVDVKTWEERSAFYAGTIEMFGMLLTFMGTIVTVIVVMSVVNTMGITVMERTREIGTLRVLGLKRRQAALLFAIEGAMLGLFGSLLGAGVHSLVWLGITIAKPMYVPPGVSEPVRFAVEYVPSSLLLMAAAMLVFALLAAVVPARRAAKQNVVVSLGYV
jgi:putative ABC transport system permease protein